MAGKGSKKSRRVLSPILSKFHFKKRTKKVYNITHSQGWKGQFAGYNTIQYKNKMSSAYHTDVIIDEMLYIIKAIEFIHEGFGLG